MRNVLLTLEYPPHRGGVARYVSALVEAFPDRFTVIEPRIAPHLWPHWLPAWFELIKRARSFDRVWVSHLHPLGTVAWLFHLFLRKPYVVILHGLDYRLGLRNAWKRFLSRRILAGADRVICNTQTLAKDVRQFLPSIAVTVLYPTLPEIFLSQAVDKMIRSDHFVHGQAESEESLRILTVARLVHRKNHASVLRALVQLPEVAYDIVGDGPERESLENLVRELGLSERVRFHTDASDEELPMLYASADVFVLTPRFDVVDVEGFGIVYLEAAAAGLPIIATRLPGVSEALCPDGTVQLPEPTPEAIARAIEELMCDPARRRSMGEANRVFARMFSPDRQFAEIASYV